MNRSYTDNGLADSSGTGAKARRNDGAFSKEVTPEKVPQLDLQEASKRGQPSRYIYQNPLHTIAFTDWLIYSKADPIQVVLVFATEARSKCSQSLPQGLHSEEFPNPATPGPAHTLLSPAHIYNILQHMSCFVQIVTVASCHFAIAKPFLPTSCASNLSCQAPAHAATVLQTVVDWCFPPLSYQSYISM